MMATQPAGGHGHHPLLQPLPAVGIPVSSWEALTWHNWGALNTNVASDSSQHWLFWVTIAGMCRASS